MDFEFTQCSLCNANIFKETEMILNGIKMCSNCVLFHIVIKENELLDMNTLIDEDYTYVLSRDILINLVKTKLTKEQFLILKRKYPNSFYLHDDFYDEKGNCLQPKI